MLLAILLKNITKMKIISDYHLNIGVHHNTALQTKITPL